MNDWLAPSVVLGAIGALATWAGIAFTRSNSKDTLLLASRDDHIEGLRKDLNETREELRQMRIDLQKQGQQISEQGEQISRLQIREWSLRRYVIVLRDFIVARGHEPPDPPHDISL